MDIDEGSALETATAGGRSKRPCVQAKVAAKESTPAKKKQKRKSSLKSFNGEELDDVTDNNDWICSFCSQSESFDGTDLVLCDGPCLRSFHMGCLDQSAELINSLEQPQWFCDDCRLGRHSCFVCGIEGEDDKDVKKCMLGRCGKYYHWSCLQDYIYRVPTSRRADAAAGKGGKTDTEQDDDEAEGIPQFRCPRHYCETCNGEYERDPGKAGPIYNCVKCPRSFHLNCIPLSARTSSLAVMCARHPYEKMPDKNRPTAGEDSGMAAAFFSQMDVPERGIRAGAHKLQTTDFLLPAELREIVANHEPDYTLIWKLDYSALCPPEEGSLTEPTAAMIRERMPALNMPEEVCICEGEVCDDKCLNRMLCIECFGGPNGKEGKEKDIKGRSICRVGAACGNRQFMNKEYVQLQTFREGGMGWGARTVHAVSRGALVIEYIGEVINTREMQRRMETQRRLTPGDHDFYIMELQPGFYVDGKRKGSASRFINHSCNPNCELTRWNVKGLIRIGIFAIRDIKAGEPLSYDYQFDTQEKNMFTCRCGSSNCRGTMAPKKKEEIKEIDRNNITKAQKQKLIATAKSKERRNAEQRLAEEKARSLTSRSVPGDANYEVRGGPSFIHFPIAKSRNIFLPRAAKKGNNFLRRHELLGRKAHLLRDRYDEMDKQNDSRDAASISNSNNEIIINSSSSGGGDSNVPSPAKKRGRPRKK